MAKRGPKPLDAAEKSRRGTLRPSRERAAGRSVALPAPPSMPVPAETRDYVAIAAGYARDVLGGRLVACQWLRLACERQDRDRLRAETDATWPYAWSDEHAVRACEFIERCPHVEGHWDTPTIRLEPWQVFLAVVLFGWRVRADIRRRRFTTCYLEVARKAAKSTLMAAIALHHLIAELEPGASVVCGASTGAQARIVFGIMQKMVRRSAWLRDQGAEVFANAILFEDGTARPVNSKAQTLDGLNPSCIVLDESHAQDFDLHDVLKSAQGARRNPLLLAPTTAGYNLLSVGYALRGQLTKVLQGVFEADHLLGVIYALDEGDDWRDATKWPKANPMLGITPKLDWMLQYCQDAQQAPGLEGEFKTKVCNLWLQSGASWLSMTRWDACADSTLRLEQFAREKCWIGGDLAQIDDLAAVALVFQRQDLLYAFVRCYLPELVVNERAKAVPAYREWADAKLLTLTDGNLIDYARIEADIRGWCKQFDVEAICFDQFGSTQIAGALSNDGLPATVEAKNAKSFTAPARELEARVRHGRFRHDGNSLLKWAASNVVVSRRIDDSILPKKESPESPNKIDPIDAVVQAIGAMLRRPAPRQSVYASRGVLVV